MASQRKPDAQSLSLVCVAKFLRSNGYSSTLAALLQEAGYIDEGVEVPDLHHILDEWRVASQTQKLARLQVDSLSIQRTRPLPDRVTTTLDTVHPTNILVCAAHRLRRRVFDTRLADYGEEEQLCIVTTAVDRTIKVRTGFKLR